MVLHLGDHRTDSGMEPVSVSPASTLLFVGTAQNPMEQTQDLTTLIHSSNLFEELTGAILCSIIKDKSLPHLPSRH